MDVQEVILTRRSIHKFKEDAVEWGKIVEILHAGRLAPNAGNVQNWKFVVVQDATQRRKISDCCEGQEWLSLAPVHIVILAEPEKEERMYGERGKYFYTTQNCAAAAMSMILSAHALGLGTCWISGFDDDKLRSVLVLPENTFPHIIIALGYPAEIPQMPPKARIEHVTYFERFWNRRKLATPHGQWSRNVMKWSREAKKNIIGFGSQIEGSVKKSVDKLRKKEE